MVKFHGKMDKNYEMVRDDVEELIMKAKESAGKVLFSASTADKTNAEQTS
jgi:hypothetical protein